VFSAGRQSVPTVPFTEAKGFLPGFPLVNARDLNEDRQLAANLPAAQLGSIEVRPVMDSDLELTDSLDQKIGAAIRRKTPGIDPTGAARIASIPQPNSTREP
jgi:hypothetical protein